MNWKNIIKRAVRTFIETALGFAAANVTGFIGEGAGLTKNALAALVVASVAAGLAALVNVPESSSRAVPDVEEIYGARETGRADCASDAAFADPARIDLFDGDRVTGEAGEGRGDE